LLQWSLEAFPAAFGDWQPETRLIEAWYLLWLVILLFKINEGLIRHFQGFGGKSPSGNKLLFFMARFLVFGGAIFAILQLSFDFEASKLFTSTAVVAAVVGIAMREVLGNYLAGISIHLVGTVEPGQWIALGDKEGEIIQRNWRETRLRTTGGHILIVPNSHLANVLVNNMSWPNNLRRHTLDFTLSFAVPPAQAREQLINAALGCAQVDLSFKKPDAWILAFRDYGVSYRLRFWSRTFHDRTALEGQVQERVWYHLQRATIAIPFPEGGQLNCISLSREEAAVSEGDEISRELIACGFPQRYFSREDGSFVAGQEALRRFAGRLVPLLFGPGETIQREGVVEPAGFILLAGEGLLVSRLHPQEAWAMQPGEMAGELSLLTGLPWPTSLITREKEGRFLKVSADALQELLAASPEGRARFESAMVQRTRIMMESLQQLDARVHWQERMQGEAPPEDNTAHHSA
ncbi:MAG: mechanosensitive ion channel family protein, partial [Magnetococcales bacterium]|nr:mechanosensitive ion channel family protein [Magnetococcales bacterium]